MRDGAEYFLEPETPEHRRYEALRAYIVEEQSAAVVAERFGYSSSSIPVLATRLRKGELDPFHDTSKPGPKPTQRPADLEEAVLELRQQDLSVYEISDELSDRGQEASHTTVWRILEEHDEPRLPKRSKTDQQEGEDNPGKRNPAPRATTKELDLSTGG